MRKLKLFFACLLMAVLSIGQMWGAVVSGTTYEVKNQAGVPSGWSTIGGFGTGGGGYAQLTASTSYVQTDEFCQNQFTSITVKARKSGGPDATQGVISVEWWEHGATSATVTLGTVSPTNTTLTNYTISNPVSVTGNKQGYIKIACNGASGGKGCGVSEVTISYTAGNCQGGDPNPGTDPEDPDPTDDADVVLDLLDGNWGLPTSGTNTALTTFTNSETGYAIKCYAATNYKVSSDYFIIGKTNSYIELPTFASPVEKIVVVKGNGSQPSGSVIFNIYDGTTSVSTAVQGCTDDQEFEIENPAANKTYTLKITSNHNLQISAIKIYYGEAVAVAKPSISGETPFLNSSTVTINKAEGTTVYYTTDGSNPKTSDTKQTYSAAFDLYNNATVKAIATDGANWSEAVEKSFVKGTVMTVDEARAAIDAVPSGTQNQFVKGIISQIDSYDQNYSSITYWISADGTTTNQLEVFGGLAGVVKAAFESKDDLNVGDSVVVKGTIKKYNSIYEFDKNNTVAYRLPIARFAWSKASYEADIDNQTSNVYPALTNTDNVAITYSSTNESAATINGEGEITLVAVGSTTITASFAGNSSYRRNSASYTLNVASSVVHATISFDVDGGTAIDPLTDKQAIVLAELPNAVKTGYNFGGWFKDSEKTVPVVAEALIGDITLHAKWLDPYTVSQAKTVIDANPDGIANQYVTGVISQIDSYNNTYHSITYWISADGATTNQLQVYGGLIGNAATALGKEDFSAKEDLELGDEVVVTGTLKLHNSTTYEFDKNNTIYSFTRPEVAVSGVTLDQNAASIEVDETVTLHETVNPDNASDKSVTWSVQSGSDKASVANGVVTGLAAGTAVIRATSVADPTKYAECTVTVTAVDPTVHHVTFIAGTDKSDETSITKDGITISATTFNNDSYYQCYANSAMTVSSTVGNITKIELTCTTEGTAKYGPGNWDFTGYSYSGANGSWTGSAETVEFGNASQQVRMTLITVTYKEDTRADANLAWDPADDIELTVGDAFSAPALVKPNDITVANITIASNNPDLATVTEGVVSLVENATGEATITATFTGDEKYKPATISYTITVSVAPLTDYYQKVTETAGIVEGTYLIVYEDGENSLAFNGGLETLDAESNTIAVTITNDNKIGVTTETAAATFYIDPAAGTVKSASDHYIGVSSWSNGLKQTDTYVHNVLEIDGDGNAQVGIYNADWNTTGGTMRLQYNKSAGQTRFRYYKNGGQQPIALYKLANEVVKASPELTWSAESVELTVGDDFTSPTFTHADGLTKTITFSSDKESVATVDANGVISLVADATGTAHITASYPGDANFKAENAVCTIKVNPAHSIYVSPSLTVNFGSVVKDASVDDKVINVTLTEVPNATATLGGDNPEVFSINPASPAALTASGDITISASSATAGVFEAKLTISDDAGLATSRVVTLKLTVTDPAAEETPISTTSKWVAATAADLVDGAEVIITGIKDEVVYAMGEQKNTNRAACIATVDGEGVLTPGEGTMSFTLVAQETEGVFALRTSDGKFLYAAKNDANHLKTQDEVDVNAKWTLSVTSAVATGSSNRNVMQFNGSSATNKLFSCYASASQSAIQFYVPKPVTPVDPTPDYTRTVEINRYGTICLPKAGVIEGAKLYDIDYYDEASTLYLLEVNGNAMVAGRPYIFLPSATSLEVFYTDDADEDAGTYRGLVGSYSEKTILVNDGNYILYENAYYLVNSTARVGANRAYIHMESVPTTPYQQQGAPRRRVAMNVYSEQTTTDIDALNASEAPVKMIIDGQLFIIRGEKMYNVNGQVVK